VTNDKRNALIDLVLVYTGKLRTETKDMTNEERVFFLETLRAGIKAAEDKFRTGPPESTGG
jgi:hypothetical protein